MLPGRMDPGARPSPVLPLPSGGGGGGLGPIRRYPLAPVPTGGHTAACGAVAGGGSEIGSCGGPLGALGQPLGQQLGTARRHTKAPVGGAMQHR